MRKPVLALVVSLLSSVSAFAADIPVIEAPEAPEVDVRRFGWTGATVGVIGGYAWLQDIDRAINFRAAGEDTIYGAYAGYQMQIG
ncbi:MAG TPA: hypothetical protein PKE65_04125, partial [Rhizobiaceae bacterium]|nr:hypothetical protein [Rhizobiaceae bacterium]